ncbi:helix-turn-helix domain-containing protein [Streptomyces sp. SID5643]|nr:helix-turn-helix domain-containing protein [Streptomyces sp. SID5643]
MRVYSHQVTTGVETGVGVLDKGMAIVDLCERTPSSGSEIARVLGMTVPTAHRLAGALVAHGLLQRAADGRFYLGPRFLTSRMTEHAQPVLARLTRHINETSQLWVARGEFRVCTASAEAETELRVSLPVGSRLPFSDGGSAAAALLGTVRSEGWVESVSQRTVGVGSVSAPVLVGDTPVAAVCVIVPIPRVTSSPGQMYGALACSAAADIAANLEG